jgi:hypothetical protein
MENNLNGFPTTGSSADDPSRGDLLAELETDRARLGERMRSQRWLAPAFGVLAALEVATAAFNDAEWVSLWRPTTIVVGVLLVVLYHRSTGVKISKWTPLAWFLMAGALVATLAFFSVALGLESFGLLWWIAAPAFAAFGVVTWLVVLLMRSVAGRVLRVR